MDLRRHGAIHAFWDYFCLGLHSFFIGACSLTHQAPVVWKLAQERLPAHGIYVAGVRYTRTSLQMPTVERRVVCFPL